jgi:hypothetical protein
MHFHRCCRQTDKGHDAEGQHRASKVAVYSLRLQYNDKEVTNQKYSSANFNVLAMWPNKTLIVYKEEAEIETGCRSDF